MEREGWGGRGGNDVPFSLPLTSDDAGMARLQILPFIALFSILSLHHYTDHLPQFKFTPKERTSVKTIFSEETAGLALHSSSNVISSREHVHV